MGRSLGLLLGTAFFVAAAAAGSNLPQWGARCPISGRDHRVLQGAFKSLDEMPESIDSTVERILVRALPLQFRRRCDAMVASWGDRVKGTASILTRPLYMKKVPDKGTLLLLAFTCYSRDQEFGDRFYDERLALLTVGPQASSLLLLPGGKDCDSCNGLSRIGFGELLPLGADTCVSIVIATSSANPCCPADARIEAVATGYYLLHPDEATMLLSIPTSRIEHGQDAAGRDSTTSYNADLFIDKDAAGSVRGIVVSGETIFSDRTSVQDRIKYEWNPKRKQFDKM